MSAIPHGGDRDLPIHRYALVERSRLVPKEGRATPVPAWECADRSADALPEDDHARDRAREVP